MCLFKKKSMELTHQNIYKRLRSFLKGGLPKEMAPFLFNENGEIRVFRYKGSFLNELKQAGIPFDADKIYEQYRHTTQILRAAFFYLRNYKVNHRLNRMYPNLELTFYDYVNNGDSEFSILDGVVRPLDDPFWLTYYPPNYIDDRSHVRVTDEPVTDISGLNLPTVENDFQFAKSLNKLAKSGRYHEQERKVVRKQGEVPVPKMEPMTIDIDKLIEDAIKKVYGED